MELHDIKNRIKYLENLVKSKKRALLKPIEQTIRVEPNGKKIYYRLFYKEKGTDKKRLLNMRNRSDRSLATAIAQRGYDAKVLRAAEAELRALKVLAKCYEAGLAEDVYEKMCEGRQRIVRPIRLTDEQYAIRWQAQEYTPKKPHPDARLFSTERGEKVNSKTEMMIANRMHYRGLHYHYEMPVELTGHISGGRYTAHPDFTVLNKRTRRTYLWEHLGRIDDPEYLTANAERLIDYQHAGIVPGEKLILTFETKNSPMMPETIDEVIDHYFV